MNDEQVTPGQQVVFREVYIPALIEKCAERGLPFPTEQALRDGLETVAMVHQALDRQQGNVIKVANHELKKSLGMDVSEVAERRADNVKTAAASLRESPYLREAILSGLNLQ